MQNPSDIGIVDLLLSQLNNAVPVCIQIDIGVVFIPYQKSIGLCLLVALKEIVLTCTPVPKGQLARFKSCLKHQSR